MKALIAALMLGGVGVALDGPAGSQSQGVQPADDRAAMRSRLERRLSEIDRLRTRVAEAIDKLDEGEPLESVRAEVSPPGGREGRGPEGRGQPGGRPPRPHDAPPEPFVGPPDAEGDRRLVLAFLDKHDTAGAQRMRDVLRDRPEDGARWVGRSAARIRAIESERDEALRGLRLKEYLIGRRAVEATRRLADALASPGHDADAAAARKDLAGVLGEQFDLRMGVARRELEVLEERVGQLKTDLAEQQGKRLQFIETRTEDLIRATREWAERERNERPQR